MSLLRQSDFKRARPERSAGSFCILAHRIEAAMTQTTHPTKEQVRELMTRRAKSNEPPPTPDRIREELGWRMIKDERKARD